jgi:predicted  nucleic acid-binding Zn-ribbon protein
LNVQEVERMAGGLEEVQKAVHGLEKQVAGLAPLVNEMHGHMPRIAQALETLARVEERQVANNEEHQRIHYRITGIENSLAALSQEKDELESSLDSLREEFIICTTTSRTLKHREKSSMGTRLKTRAAERAVEWATIAVLTFVGWLVLAHLKEYPQTAAIVGTAAPEQGGKP